MQSALSCVVIASSMDVGAFVSSPPAFHSTLPPPHLANPRQVLLCAVTLRRGLSERGQYASLWQREPQFPRQLYNCFGRGPSATGRLGVIDVKRNAYEMRRGGGRPYGSVRALTQGRYTCFLGDCFPPISVFTSF